MNVDSGISRVLPPLADNAQQDKGIDNLERNTLLVRINHQDKISVGGRQVDVIQIKDIAKEFILNPNDDPNLPQKEEQDIPLIGKYMVSKGIISLQNDKSTSYDTYIQVQNELTKAYNEVRNELSIKSFGKSATELTDADQKKALTKAVQTKISEAEARDLSKKK